MKIKVTHGELTEASGHALLVPTDGNVKDHYGSTCRAALKLTGKEVAPHGFGNGSAVMEPCSGPFRYLVFLGTIADTEQKQYLRAAFARGLDLCLERGCQEVVTPLLAGGWRIRPVDAITEMLNVIERPGYQGRDVTLTLIEKCEERAQLIQGCLDARGY